MHVCVYACIHAFLCNNQEHSPIIDCSVGGELEKVENQFFHWLEVFIIIILVYTHHIKCTIPQIYVSVMCTIHLSGTAVLFS